MAAGKHTLRSGKLHRRDKKAKITTTFRVGDRFDATERELAAFGDCIITWPAYLSLTSDAVAEVEGDDTKPTAKPKAKRKSRAKKAAKPEPEADTTAETGDDEEPESPPDPSDEVVEPIE